jgi:phosphohistidine swiveling domain-containing protein
MPSIGGFCSPIVIENGFVPIPTALAALTVKLDVPTAVGVPEITPVVPARFKPVGNVPLPIVHVIGVSPVAASVWLYAVPTVPFGNVAVVIVGAIPSPTAVIVMDNGLVLFPAALVALTVKLDVPAVVGVPEITPVPARLKPAGNEPSILHVMGVSPVALSVWLYEVPTVPPGNVVVVIFGAFPPPPVPLPSPQAAKENPIIATMAIIPDNLILFFIKHTPYGYWDGAHCSD